jgi:DNA-binding XRE family transcriptional regulator
MSNNNLRELRESLMMSKAELARKANISSVTVTRIEQGRACRIETKRKIVLALGYNLSDKNKVFDEDSELPIS